MAQTLPPAWNPDRFAGNNGEYEIETLDEFLKISQGVPPEQLNGKDYVFQEVDFSSMPAEVFRKYNFAGSNFWGCTLPEGTSLYLEPSFQFCENRYLWSSKVPSSTLMGKRTTTQEWV